MKNKKQLDENIDNEVIKIIKKSFKINYFLYKVDKVVT